MVPIYVAILFLFLYLLHRKFHDKNLFLGIFVSAIFYIIIDVNFSGWLFYLFSLQFVGYFLFCFICGITAGIFSPDTKIGALSGAIGMLLAMNLTYPSIYFIIFVFGIYFPFQTLPRILGGAIGGVLGSYIRNRYDFRKKTIIKSSGN
ncbi:MAG: hypothetical protein ACFFDB_02965 [Promethearchaeota archaeon]